MDYLLDFDPLIDPRLHDFAQEAAALMSIETESANAQKPPTSGYTSKVHVLDKYEIVGFISSGTYGRVYKAVGKNGVAGEFAIKKCGGSPTLRLH